MAEREVILYISMSVDGFIATTDNNLDFLSSVFQEGEDYGYTDFLKTVDTVIIGRKTYEKVISMGFEYPHIDKAVYILTRTPRSAEGSFIFYSGDPIELVRNLKSQPGKHIYCDGGAEIANLLMENDLIDTYILSVIPILLGSGIPLFNKQRPQHALTLLHLKSFDSGLVQFHYKRNHP